MFNEKDIKKKGGKPACPVGAFLNGEGSPAEDRAIVREIDHVHRASKDRLADQNKNMGSCALIVSRRRKQTINERVKNI